MIGPEFILVLEKVPASSVAEAGLIGRLEAAQRKNKRHEVSDGRERRPARGCVAAAIASHDADRAVREPIPASRGACYGVALVHWPPINQHARGFTSARSFEARVAHVLLGTSDARLRPQLERRKGNCAGQRPRKTPSELGPAR